MLIGQDYDKIEFKAFGLDLLEPNALIGDSLIFLFSIYFFFKVTKLGYSSAFYTWWKRFFFVFGLGFFVGGLGHLFYNYWGVEGKYFSWFMGITASYCIEQAMIVCHPNTTTKSRLKWLSVIKNLGFALSLLYMILTADLNINPHTGMIFPTLNSVIGLGFALGYLGYYYAKNIDPNFKYLWMSALIMLPSALTQAFKISIHQWFDRNDIGHLLLIISMFFYYASISRVSIQREAILVSDHE